MLPEPTTELKLHSSQLQHSMRKHISHHHGWIGFDQFMDQALYAPGLGYYDAGLANFGEAGDFITAPLMGNLMAHCLAKQSLEVLTGIGRGGILEFGSGNGQLAADMLLAMKALGHLPAHYFILETSAELRSRQRETIFMHCGELGGCVTWLEQLPEAGFDGVVVANEVLDAIPAIRFEIDERGAAMELGVSSSEQEFRWRKSTDPLPEHLQSRLEARQLTAGYQSEMGLRAEAWVRSIGEKINTGVMFLIDYGFPQHEYYHVDRRHGTLMCHYQHVAHSNPFFYPGLQDISVHVDFTAITRAAQQVQLSLAGFTTQGAFLLSLGVLDMLVECQRGSGESPKRSLELSRQIKKLTMPHEMGELFKVIAFTRNYSHALSGFSLKDHRGRLR